jgi:excisionase family DNA binding protein
MAAKTKHLTVNQAAKRLGVPRRRISDMIRRGQLHTETNPLDRRSRLILESEIERLSALPRAPKRKTTAPGEAAAVGRLPVESIQSEALDSSEETPPWPRTAAAYDFDIPSDQYKEWLRENWHPA